MELKEFLGRLFGACEQGQVELRALPAKNQAFHRLGDWPAIEAWCQKHKGQNLYFAVATRNGGGTKDHIVQIPGLWCDIDFKDVPKDQAAERLRQFPLRPSLVVNSGGGYHAYWVLKEPLGREDIPRVEAALRQIQAYLGGDPAATDASRILRLPGTFNQKYDPARLVTVHTANDFTYLLEDIAEDLPAAPRSGVEVSRGDVERRTSDEIERIMQCSFLQHCDHDRATLPESEWYCMVSNLARVQGGPAKIHELSRGYPAYDPKETNEKILHAIDDAGPHTCEYIKRLWDCEKDCGAKAPVALARKGASANQGPWPDPLELTPTLPAVPTMPDVLLPETLRAYAADVAERMQIPLDYVGIPFMVTLGFLVARKVGIFPKRHDDWIVSPNLWGMTIGRPGLLKSPAQERVTELASRLERESQENFSREWHTRETHRRVVELKIQELEKQMREAIKKGEAEQIKSLEQLMTELNIEREADAAFISPTYIVGDITVEKIQTKMQENPGGLLQDRDELSGLFISFDKEGWENAREFYLESWSGTRPYKVDRMGRPSVYIRSTRLSIIGSIQPGKLQKHIARALERGQGDDGLIQRFQLAVWPNMPGKWVNVDRWPNTIAKQAAYQAFKNLDTVNPGSIGAVQSEWDIVPSLRFYRDAQEIFDDWLSALENRLRGNELQNTPAFESHLAKYRSLMPSLALIFHVVDVVSGKADGAVSREAALRAVEWCRFLEAHAKRIYADELQGGILPAYALAEKITSGMVTDGESIRDISRNGWTHLGSTENVWKAIGVLEAHHWVKSEKRGPQGRGRPGYDLRINPKVLTSREGDEDASAG
jgi:hypothetical protein